MNMVLSNESGLPGRLGGGGGGGGIVSAQLGVTRVFNLPYLISITSSSYQPYYTYLSIVAANLTPARRRVHTH